VQRAQERCVSRVARPLSWAASRPGRIRTPQRSGDVPDSSVTRSPVAMNSRHRRTAMVPHDALPIVRASAGVYNRSMVRCGRGADMFHSVCDRWRRTMTRRPRPPKASPVRQVGSEQVPTSTNSSSATRGWGHEDHDDPTTRAASEASAGVSLGDTTRGIIPACLPRFASWRRDCERPVSVVRPPGVHIGNGSTRQGASWS
jgi:hypothetical protein